MLADIIEDIVELCSVSRAEVVPTPRWLSDYLQESIFLKGLSRLGQDRHAVEMTAALFEDQRVVPLETDASGWSSLLLTINKEASSISTAAGAAVVHVLEAGGDLTFNQCRVKGVDSFHDIPAGARLGSRTSFAVRAGDTFVVPQGMQAIRLEGTSTRVKLLRFNGPVAAPISLAFDPGTGRMMSSSFSQSEATGRHFFSILLGEMTRAAPSSKDAVIPANEREAIADLLDGLWSDDVHAYTRWRLAQVLARLRPSSAIARLQAMTSQDLPNLRRHAEAALTKVSGVEV
jgi:hypothetical protein